MAEMLDGRIKKLLDDGREGELRDALCRHFPQREFVDAIKDDLIRFLMRRQSDVLAELERIRLIPELFSGEAEDKKGEALVFDVASITGGDVVPSAGPLEVPEPKDDTLPIDGEIFDFYAGLGDSPGESVFAPNPPPERLDLAENPVGFFVYAGNPAARRPMTLLRILSMLHARFGLETMVIPESVRSSREPAAGSYALTMAFERAPFELPIKLQTATFPEEALYALFWATRNAVIIESRELVVFPETKYVVPRDTQATRLLGREAKKLVATEAPMTSDNPRVLCLRQNMGMLLLEAVPLHSVVEHAQLFRLRPVVRTVLR